MATYAQGYGTGTYHSGKRKKRHTGLIIALVIIAVILALLAAIAYLGLNAVNSAKAKAQTLSNDAQQMMTQAQSGGTESLTSALATYTPILTDDVDSLQTELNNSFWSFASKLPVIGEDVSAAQDLVDVADQLVSDVLTPVSSTVSTYALQDIYTNGTFNGPAVQAYCDLIQQITPAVREASDALGSIYAPHVSQVNEAVEKISPTLESASSTLEQISPIASVIPDILGCNGTRTYLVVAMNNAEIRSTGGMPGAMLYVSITDGQPYIGEVSNAQDFANESTGGVQIPLTDEENAAFGSSPGNMIQNVNFIPSFPRVCDLLCQYWMRDYNVTFDGVIALDIPMLQRIIAATGDVEMSDGTVLSADTTISMLMHDVYVNYTEGDDQDAYFVEGANKIISNLFSMDFSAENLSALLDAVQSGIDGGHLLMWMADSDEEAQIEALGCAGEISDSVTSPELGVYLVDATWSKIDWYLRAETQIGDPVTNEDGSKTYTVTTSLTNTMSWDEITSGTIHSYIYGGNPAKADEGDMLTIVYLMAPAGATIEGIDTSAFDTSSYYTSQGTLYGHQMIWGLVHAEPGQTVTITYSVTVPAEATEELSLNATPMYYE
jgi:type II secretory pathway pseudopilin PulG